MSEEKLRAAIREALTFQHGGVILSDGSAILQDALEGKFDFNFPSKIHRVLCELFDRERGLSCEIPKNEILDALDETIRHLETAYPWLVK
jgi:hypothetical protein